jgi:predicted nucleotidyltransferase component of viral defense system
LLLHGLDRFSTDLDFDLMESGLDEDDILDRVGKILSKHGEVKELIIKRYTIFGLVSYGDIDRNVKFEINRRGLTGGYHMQSLHGIDFLVMNREDLCANKFLALLGRNRLANRDIYDVHFILDRGFEINKALIEAKTGMNFSEYIGKMIAFLE